MASPEAKATLLDVARLAMVSPSTDSRAIRMPSKVAPATRERREAADATAG
jgi:DNA-binding LacI/PurR family transcriptional regulator